MVVGPSPMDQVTWESILWYTLVVVLISSWHWILGLLGAISIYDLFNSWHKCSFKLKKPDSRLVQIYSSTKHSSNSCFSTKWSIGQNQQVHQIYPRSISWVSPELPSVRVVNAMLRAINQHQALIMPILQNHTQEKKSSHYTSHMNPCIKTKETTIFTWW